MAVASTCKALGAAKDTEVDFSLIDVAAISWQTDIVLRLRMGTTTRAAMARHLPKMANDWNRLLGEDLGAEDDGEVRELIREGTRLIDLTNRPAVETPIFGTFVYLRDIALLTRRLLWIYSERNGLNAP